jgi:glycine/D-amino acid oxidase-like deaminating enzyme
MPDFDCDVLVIGGGIVGAACAEACASAGERVRLVEGGRVASGTTGAGMGHLVALPGDGPNLALSRFGRQLWAARGAELPPEVGYRTCGTLWLAASAADAERIRAMEAQLGALGESTTRLDARGVRELEPELSSIATEGLLVPADAVLDPAGAARHLSAATRKAGGEVEEGRGVAVLLGQMARLDDGERVKFRDVVVAAGTRTGRLLPEVPVLPRKGHLLRYGAPDRWVRHQLAEVGYLQSVADAAALRVAFNVQPAPGGGVIVGASRQSDRDDLAVEPEVVARLEDRAVDFLPGLSGVPRTGSWAGLRPATPDHRAFIGPVPGRPHVFLATGHEGLGITCALATGRLIAELVGGRAPSLPLEPFLPSGRLTASVQGPPYLRTGS